MPNFPNSKVSLVAGVIFALSGCGGADSGSLELQTQLLRLEARAARVRDANDIKRLQRVYGYYVDEALWDEVVDLFAEDASVEYGLDGVYVGKARIQEYLYALGDGESGLGEGQLHDHLQLMGVVTVAPDGRTARARWRGLILAGRLGESATWGEGPYENEYVKQDGVWKISRLHWYDSMIVPYETGWQNTADPTGGVFVSASLPPDRPPTVDYETWPGAYLPPFHFPNPVLGARPPSPPDPSADAPVSTREMDERAVFLTHEIGLMENENAIENLQRIYGFYTDKQLWGDAAGLFADNGTLEIGGSGVYVGPERIREYLSTYGPEGPQDGRLFDQMQLQPVVHVSPDGVRARARWHIFAQEAVWGEYARWGLGVYENEYVKEGGVWKIQSLHQYTTMYTPYEDGWGKTALPLNTPLADLPPDRPPTGDYAAYPHPFVAPFHYENPVTGGPTYSGSPEEFALSASGVPGDLGALLTSLDGRMTLLEDADAIERLNAIYGYYLARNQWDDLAGIFAPDGSIEIAMRGVYVGSQSVRRNLDLYGEPGVQRGLLHNHMQYQPVIHVAEDGLTAKMRSRAFSIMGQFGAYAQWMGGVYENDFVKEDGIWKVQRDQVFNSYFTPYAVGWKDQGMRPPPGINADNPPDLPPTMPFEMYPVAFLPPFHYGHPVRGD